MAALLLTACAAALAGGIAVERAELRASSGEMQMAADFSINLNTVAEQALTHGVPLYFVGEYRLISPRWYWLDQVVAQGEQTVRLSYNILTRQYRISHGALHQNLGTLADALHVLSHLIFPAFPQATIRPGGRYQAQVRLRLDATQLPKPLQINALANNDWDHDSGWHRWELPATPARGGRFWDFN